VQCCVPGCLQTVRKLRLHIRRSHKKLCPLSCSACQARFVGQNDLNNHHRNGCSRVMSERGTGKGTRGKRVQCPKCFTTVRKLRLHIRKFHKELCRVSCSDCQARFVEQNDLNNHHRDGCPRRKHISYRVTATPGSLIGKHKAMCLIVVTRENFPKKLMTHSKVVKRTLRPIQLGEQRSRVLIEQDFCTVPYIYLRLPCFHVTSSPPKWWSGTN